jgi:hypothetical protein
MRAAIDIILLDADWRPRRRLRQPGDWRDAIGALLRHDGGWFAIEQRRADGDDILPSRNDIALTRALHRRLRPLEILLADHVIRAGDRTFSFRAAGLL